MSHLGLYLIGFGLLSSLGLASAALLAVGDGLAKTAMFFGVGILQQRRSSVSELRLRGKGAGLPVAGAIVALGALVAADLPPFAAASGKGHPRRRREPTGPGVDRSRGSALRHRVQRGRPVSIRADLARLGSPRTTRRPQPDPALPAGGSFAPAPGRRALRSASHDAARNTGMLSPSSSAQPLTALSTSRLPARATP